MVLGDYYYNLSGVRILKIFLEVLKVDQITQFFDIEDPLLKNVSFDLYCYFTWLKVFLQNTVSQILWNNLRIRLSY